MNSCKTEEQPRQNRSEAVAEYKAEADVPPTFLFIACLNLFDEAVTTKANRLTNLHQRREGRNVERRGEEKGADMVYNQI